jgi:hypothetical protein
VPAARASLIVVDELVTITIATPGAVLHYSTTGVDPTESDPVIPSRSTVVAGHCTLNARAFLSGWTSSDVKTAAYTVTGPFTNWAVLSGTHTVALRTTVPCGARGTNVYGQLVMLAGTVQRRAQTV